MTRKEVLAEGVELYLGDCLEILPTLDKFDAVVTDPPYQLSQESNGLRELNYGDWDSFGSADISVAALKLLSMTPSIIAWGHWDQWHDFSVALPGRSRRPLAWIKTNPTVINGQHLFLPAFETGYYGKLPGAWFGGVCVPSAWRGSAPIGREHPTQKPLELMQWCVVNTVAPSASAIDPFMGSGTTGVAAVKLGRKFTGIEIDGGYFDIACRRIETALKQPDMFIEPPKPAKQEAFL